MRWGQKKHGPIVDLPGHLARANPFLAPSFMAQPIPPPPGHNWPQLTTIGHKKCDFRWWPRCHLELGSGQKLRVGQRFDQAGFEASLLILTAITKRSEKAPHLDPLPILWGRRENGMAHGCRDHHDFYDCKMSKSNFYVQRIAVFFQVVVYTMVIMDNVDRKVESLELRVEKERSQLVLIVTD